MTKEEYESKTSLYKTLSKEATRLRLQLWKARVLHFVKYEKRKAIKLGCILVVIGFLMQVLIFNNIESTLIKRIPGNVKIVYLSDTLKNFKAFLEEVGKLESGGRYEIVNSGGFMGKYQIGRVALNDIGMGGITDEDFLTTPAVQELAMKMLLRKNKKYLQTYIGKYSSTKIGNIRIDESAILAGAHLTGAGSVMQFLDSNGLIDHVDGNGIETSSRLKRFFGYKLEL